MKDVPHAQAIPTTLVFLALVSFPFVVHAESSPQIDFQRDIGPLLASRCYNCHGPNDTTREAELNLSDRKQVFSQQAENGQPLLTPGDPAQTEIYLRIVSDDPDLQMPPPDAEADLDPEEIKLIRRWISSGAMWEPHWSLQALPPANEAIDRTGRHPIDQFVQDRLKKEHLAPASPAKRERIIHRLSLDLTGLPPTPAETDAFLSDATPEAYERLVDRLLDSPRYGVRMASSWLDLARYADTSGYQIDRYRDVWPWRDWVVRAMNENMPFDEFVTWQLAGDLLPDATHEQRLATAFNRLHRQNEESGAVPEEFRAEYVADRVITVGTALLGLTLECARCHTHKYDPVTQKEFFQLCSFFDNIDEAGVNSSETDAMPVPTLLLGTAAERQELLERGRNIEAAEAELAAYTASPTARNSFNAWRQNIGPARIPQPTADYPLESFEEGKLENSADPAKPGLAKTGPKQVEGARGKGILLNGDTQLSFKEVGAFSRTDPFSLSLYLWTPDVKKRAVIVHRSRAALDAASRGYELLIEDGHLHFGLAHMWPGNALRIRDRKQLPQNRWVHVLVTYDGSSHAEGAKLYIDGERADVDIVRDVLTKDILYDRKDIHLTIGERWRDAGFKDGRVDEFQVFDQALSPLEVAHNYDGESLIRALESAAISDASQQPDLFEYYLSHHDSEYRQRRDQLQQLRKEQSALIEPIAELMVMDEMAEPRPTYRLEQGQYNQQREQVFPSAPASILPFDETLPPNRLGLARWFCDPKHPLTARVAVNRYWELFFGRGLVDPPNDFGTQGNPPTHPKLLDYLAARYIESGWNTKDLIRHIVTSATYRQSSIADLATLEKDPNNLLLSRGPRYRLNSEMIRDSALHAGGILAETMGGPPVRPYQPPGLWVEKEARVRYEPSTGEDLYRRSLYTIWKRTSPPPAMVAFDAPTRSVCTANRQRTGTPLQALVLLNDVQFVEAARCFAERILREGGETVGEQLDFAFRVATGRCPEKAEAALLRELYQQQQQFYAGHSDQAKLLIQIGEKPLDDALHPVDVATLTTIASTLLNHDEFVTKR
ncbi:MAG: DUF1553 domain-containing protein [Pirellulales bacterium]|nr:DUF1553 domain-containing protein [Pirellulales bacterium]